MLDINADMLRSAAAGCGADAGDARFVAGNAEALPLPDRTLRCLTIAFGIRNVPRIPLALAEAYRVLKRGGRFLCLEFSAVDVPGLDRLYDAFSFSLIPAHGQAGAGRRRALPLPRRIDPPLSRAPTVRRHDRATPASGASPPRG